MTALAGGRIFHLVDAGLDVSTGKSVALDQYELHGFVHCCFREQLAEVASWWFPPRQELVVLELDSGRLTGPLRFEASPRRWYPHVYGPVDAGAVVASHAVPRTADGRPELPAGLSSPPPSYRLKARRQGREVWARWRGGEVEGDPGWLAAAHEAVADGRPVESSGGGPGSANSVPSPATLTTPFESFSLLVDLADELVRYDGDGFEPA